MPDISLLIKPASSLCNLRCKYCFYADVSDLRSVRSFGILSNETAECVIRRAIEATGNHGRIHFAFQGGEPTLAGLSFFKNFTDRVTNLLPPGVSADYSIQTNGLLLDDEFCAFLAEHRFLVGLSVDGDREYHDACRCDASGGTFSRVSGALNRLRVHGVEFNILTVVTAQIAAHPQKLWHFCQKNRIDYLQTIPCLPPLENPEVSDFYTLTPRKYGRFLKDFFRIWAKETDAGNYISVRLFDNYVHMAMGQVPEMCGMRGFCTAQFVIEADGSVYPCDFYVLDSLKIGNVSENSFEQMAKSEVLRDFLKKGTEKPPICQNCRFYGICGGGCRRYRDLLLREENYCPIADFLSECAPGIKQIANKILRHEYGGIYE